MDRIRRWFRHYAGAMMLSMLMLVILGGVGWNGYVSCERQALRDEYRREIEAQRDREERRLEEMVSSCRDTERELPFSLDDPEGLALELMCDHILHDATIEHTDVGITMLRCTCNPERFERLR